MVYYAEGMLTVDGQDVRAGSRDHRPQLEDGQTVSSTRGHAEILLGPNAVLWTGTRAQIRFDDTRLEDTNISVLTGSAIIEVKKTQDGSRLRVHLGTLSAEVTKDGVYRFEAAPPSVRVYSGEVLVPVDAKVTRGEEALEGAVKDFDRKIVDEFFYWAAYRSFILEGESGSYKNWRGGGRLFDRDHSGFGISFPDNSSAARAKYLAGGEAGLVYFLEGGALLGGQTRTTNRRLPLLMGKDNFLRTETGRAEIFLGIGVVARLAPNSQLRMIDTSAASPVISLDEGIASIEVADSADGSHPRVKVDDSMTELLKPGLYHFDAKAGSLLIYGGEASTVFAAQPQSPIRAKEAQTVNLRERVALATFDIEQKNPLFQWAADRSFALYMSPAAFMTQWEDTARRNRYKHKQFGEREDPRARPRPRPLRRLP